MDTCPPLNRSRRNGRSASLRLPHRLLVCLTVVIIVPCVCAQPRRPLGDRSLSGKLPWKWEELPVSGHLKVRVARMWIPHPWELHVYPAPQDAEPHKEPGWKFVRNDKRKAPKTLVCDKQREVVYRVWIYRGRVGDMPLLAASADQRLNQKQVEWFLNGLRRVVGPPSASVEGPARITGLKIESDAKVVIVGGRQQLRVWAVTKEGAVDKTKDCQYRSSDKKVADVLPGGVVRGKWSGKVTITASLGEIHSGPLELQVLHAPPPMPK